MQTNGSNDDGISYYSAKCSKMFSNKRKSIQGKAKMFKMNGDTQKVTKQNANYRLL